MTCQQSLVPLASGIRFASGLPDLISVTEFSETGLTERIAKSYRGLQYS